MRVNKSKTGKRSGFEDVFSNAFPDFEWEPHKLVYEVREIRRYTPDFWDSINQVYYETKGRFTAEDRKKMKLVVEQHPDKRIIMVFQNPNKKLTKSPNSKTYALWCEKNGIEWTTLKLLKESRIG